MSKKVSKIVIICALVLIVPIAVLATVLMLTNVKNTVELTVVGQGTYTGLKESGYLTGEECSLTAVPAEGYDLVGWKLDGATQYAATTTTYTFKVEGNVKLTVEFAKRKFTLVFNFTDRAGLDEEELTFNNVEWGTSFASVLGDDKIAINSINEEKTYKFKGWFNGNAQYTETKGTLFETAGTKKVTAQWNGMYYVTFLKGIHSDALVDLPEENKATYEEGSSPNFPVAEKLGHSYAGWKVNGLGTSFTKAGGSMPVGEVNLYLDMSPYQYTIIYKMILDGVEQNFKAPITNPNNTTLSYGNPFEEPTGFDSSEYTFDGWFYNETNITGNYASFELQGTYTVHAKLTSLFNLVYEGNGYTNLDEEFGTIRYGTALKAGPSTDVEVSDGVGGTYYAKFAGWYIGTTKYTEARFTQAAGSTVTLTAKWQKRGQISIDLGTEADVTTQVLTPYIYEGDSIATALSSVISGIEGKIAGNELTRFVIDSSNKWTTTGALTGNYVYTADVTEYELNWLTAYRVTFKLENGTEVIATKYYTENFTITGIPVPTINGYNGLGWFDDATLMNFTSGYTVGTEAKDFVYKCEIITYTITYNTNDGTINAGKIDDFTVESSEITLPTDVTKENYGFRGWFKNENFTGDEVTTIPAESYGDVELWAKWEKTTFGITYELGGMDVAISDQYKAYTVSSGSDGKVTLPTAAAFTTPKNFTFGGWYTSPTFTGSEIKTFNASDLEDKIFYARWLSAMPLDLLTNYGGLPIKDEKGNQISEHIGLSSGTVASLKLSQIYHEVADMVGEEYYTNGGQKLIVQTIKVIAHTSSNPGGVEVMTFTLRDFTEGVLEGDVRVELTLADIINAANERTGDLQLTKITFQLMFAEI